MHWNFSRICYSYVAIVAYFMSEEALNICILTKPSKRLFRNESEISAPTSISRLSENSSRNNEHIILKGNK